MKDLLFNKRKSHLGKHIRRNNLPENFCSAPFTQMFLYPTGDVYVCCEGAGHLGNIKEKTLEELWNGTEAQNLRKEFLDGQPKQCSKKISCQGCNKSYDEQLPYADLSIVQSQPPAVLDVILNGKCNIDCIMCEVKDKIQSLPALPQFKEEIEKKVFPYLKEISVKSGEPFVQPETYSIIDTLQSLNPDCTWRFTTNGQYTVNESLKKRLNKIKINRITFSVDSIIPEEFAKIRAGGHFSRLEESIKQFQEWDATKDQPNAIDFEVNITLQKENWKSVPETYKHYFDLGLQPHLIFVSSPEKFSPADFTNSQKIEVLNYYLNLPKNYNLHFQNFYNALKPLFLDSSDVLLRKFKTLFEMRLSDILKERKNICTLPFSQISIYPDGSLKPCCWLGDYHLAKPKADISFSKVWNDQPIQNLRADLINGKFKICTNNMNHISCQSYHTNFSHLSSLSVVQKKQIPVLHWYFNGKCNLQCPMCNNWQHDTEFSFAEEYWLQLKKEVLPYLCEIDLVGGEPFFQARTYKLIDYVSQANPLCCWTITSNGQLEFEGKIKNSLEKIKVVHFAVSIDSFNDKIFSDIRKNGELKKALKFSKSLKKYNDELPLGQRFKISINFVLQQKNYHELEKALNYCIENNFELYIIPLVSPSDLSIYSFDLIKKYQILKTLEDLSEKYPLYNLEQVKKSLHQHLLRSKEVSGIHSIDL